MKTLISSSTHYRLVQSSLCAIVCLLIGFNLVNAQTQKAAKKVEKHTEFQSFMHTPRSNNKLLNCENSLYRTIDGTCNNPANTEWSATDIQLMRTMATAYSQPNTWNNMAGANRLSPRAISNHVSSQSESTPSPRNLSSFVFTWKVCWQKTNFQTDHYLKSFVLYL